jgi:iron complex outermembrane recepter protein
VPIPVSVVSGELIDRASAFNINRLKELIPTVQFYSSNPRNSAINIRGLGAPFGLTNDGSEPGVGYYVDGVFYARPAAATLDFVDLERIEVLRGPQGTLFGKNTTAGAINVTTRRPSLTPEAHFELSYGNLGFLQAKGSISGPLTRKLAGRLSFTGTQRDGVLYNVRTQDDVNDLNNQGVRGQLMYIPSSKVVIMAAADVTRQRPEGYAQTLAGIAPTLRAANRQYPQIAADLGYRPVSLNAFDRLIDTDSPWRSNQDMGGASLTVDWTLGKGQLTSITAWRFWDWDPSNDRDFIGLPVTTISAAPSKQRQWTQEVRYAGSLSSKASFLLGVFTFHQTLTPSPFHTQEQGEAAARFLLAPSALASTPGLLAGYGQNIDFDFTNTSSAVFGQVEYAINSRWRLIPGVRVNHDQKKLDYDQRVYGGLQTTNPALIALQRSILSPLAYKTDVSDGNVSGQMTVSYKAGEFANAYATYSTGFKSIGVNLGGVPTDAAGAPILSAATVRPESVRHIELGFTARPHARVTTNVAAFQSGIRDFQTQVVNAQVGVLRGYLANADKVRVRGIEFDAQAVVADNVRLYASAAFTDGRYISFRDAPPPVEETGGPQAKDISGSVLPGISRWAVSYGGEYTKPASLLGLDGEVFVRADTSFRSRFSSSPSFSRYLLVDSYSLLNPRTGFRSRDGWSFSIWARNLTGTNYFELMSAAPGNSGLLVGLPGDPRTFGITLSHTFKDRGVASRAALAIRAQAVGFTAEQRTGGPSLVREETTPDSPQKAQRILKNE